MPLKRQCAVYPRQVGTGRADRDRVSEREREVCTYLRQVDGGGADPLGLVNPKLHRFASSVFVLLYYQSKHVCTSKADPLGLVNPELQRRASSVSVLLY
jgi:hypothetical protein